MRLPRVALLVGGVAVAGVAAGAPASRQVVTGPVAVYWMSASTSSGMGAMMGGGGGGRPSLAAIMAMRNGGGASYTHGLTLQLGSEQRPAGDPTAEHDPPQGLDVGPVLPLLTPLPSQPGPQQPSEPGPPPQFQKPHGRMLIFWGCGEHAGPGQPLVIDFAQMAEGQIPPVYASLMHSMIIQQEHGPSADHNPGYGEWPNRETNTTVPQNGSLLGDHYIHGNYSPDIRFTLSGDQDFLPPFIMTQNVRNPSGSASLAWQPIPPARAFFASMFGAGQDQIVMWTSSQSQTAAFALPDYMSDGETARMVAAGALLPPGTTSCVIPTEAVSAAGRAGFFMLKAYGGETNIAFPPRPPAPRPWNIAWEVKVRYKSGTSGLVGMDMSRMMGGGGQRDQGDQDQQQQQPQQKPQHPSIFNPFGGLIPH